VVSCGLHEGVRKGRIRGPALKARSIVAVSRGTRGMKKMGTLKEKVEMAKGYYEIKRGGMTKKRNKRRRRC
jgi:hypothetical protein